MSKFCRFRDHLHVKAYRHINCWTLKKTTFYGAKCSSVILGLQKTIALSSIVLLDFVTRAQCVFCAVKTKYTLSKLNFIHHTGSCLSLGFDTVPVNVKVSRKAGSTLNWHNRNSGFWGANNANNTGKLIKNFWDPAVWHWRKFCVFCDCTEPPRPFLPAVASVAACRLLSALSVQQKTKSTNPS